VSIRGQIFGNLYMAEKRGAPEFTEEDEAILVALAAAASVAVENARLYDRTTRQRGFADAVAELTQHLLEGGQSEDALRRMALRCTDLVRADLSVVALYDDQRRLRVRATSDINSRRGVGAPLGPGRWDDIIAEGEPLLLVTHADETPSAEVAAIRAVTGAQGNEDQPGPTALVAIAVGESALGLLGVAWPADDDGTSVESLDSLRAFGRTAALALEAATAQRDRGRLELLEDRDRIARDMHDHVIQRLFATGLSLQSASRLATDQRLIERLDTAVDELDTAIKDIRQAIFALHRPIGASAMTAQVTELVDQAAEALGFAPHAQLPAAWDALATSLEPEVLAVVREGLVNVVRHARATWCCLTVGIEGEVCVQVEDDGIGMPPDAARSGLVNLRQRAAQLGGTLTIAPREPAGTRVSWQVPLPAG
jgi:signal transduction histidine kinase